MNIRFLETFLVVVEEKSFSAAAKRLYLTQPAVTKHIQSLEKHFQVALFDRKGWQSQLTEAGEVLLGYAKKIVSNMEEAERALRQVGEEIKGILRIGASTVPGEYVLPLLVGDFSFQYPEVHLQLEIGDSGNIRQMVLGGELDLGMVGFKYPEEQLEYYPFAQDRLVLVVPLSHPFARRSSITAQELTEVPLIWREKDSGTRQVAEEVLASQGVDLASLKIRMELGSTEAVLNAAVTGNGATIISKHAADRFIRLKRLVEVEIEHLEFKRPLYLVYRKDKKLSRVIATFIDYVQAKSAVIS